MERAICQTPDRLTNMIHIVSIEGNIGAGKSTILRHIEKQLSSDDNVVVVLEPIDKWSDDGGINVFKAYCEDPDRRAAEFQVYAFTGRLIQLAEIVNGIRARYPDPANVVVITERSIQSDCEIFAKTSISDPVGRRIYDTVYSAFEHLFAKSGAVVSQHVYIHTEPTDCMKRIHERQRPGEEHLTLARIQELHNAHEAWLGSDPQCFQFENRNGHTDVEQLAAHILSTVMAAVTTRQKEIDFDAIRNPAVRNRLMTAYATVPEDLHGLLHQIYTIAAGESSTVDIGQLIAAVDLVAKCLPTEKDVLPDRLNRTLAWATMLATMSTK